MRIRTTIVTAVSCGALLLTGCGSADSGSSEGAAESAPASSPASAPASSPASAPAEPAAAAEPSESPSEATAEELEALGDVEVDQGLLSVTVTLPADLAEGTTQATIDTAIANGEVQEGQLNDDGTVTYVLSKAQHEESLKQLRVTVDELVAEENKTNPGLYEEVTYNDEMTEFRVVVSDQKTYEQSMSMLTLGLIFGASFYQIFYGVPEEDRNVVVEFVDGTTGDVFDTFDAREESS